MFYNRPNRLRYDLQKSVYMTHFKYLRVRWHYGFLIIGIYHLLPHASIRTIHWLDKLPYWENKIEQRTIKKTAFDFMLKNAAERDKDLIEEYSDF